MEGGSGENGQVALIGVELFCLPGVWEGLGIQFGVGEHLLEFGVVKGAVERGVGILLRWGGGWLGQWGGMGGGTRWERGSEWLDKGGGLTTCRETLLGGCGGRVACSGDCGASCGEGVVTRCDRSRRADCWGQMSLLVADSLAIFEERSWRLERSP